MVLFSFCKPQSVSGCVRVKPLLYFWSVMGSDHWGESAHGRISSSGAVRLHPFPALQNPVLSKSLTEMARCYSMEGTKPLAILGFPVAGDTGTNSLTSMYEIIYFTFLVLNLVWNSLSKTAIKGTKLQRRYFLSWGMLCKFYWQKKSKLSVLIPKANKIVLLLKVDG